LVGANVLNSKTSGQYHSTKGNVVEAVGNVTGASSWTESGKQEHAQGETEYKAAQTKGYAEGTADRLGGKKDTIVGAVTGDRSQEASGALPSNAGQDVLELKIVLSGNARRDKGEAQQELNKHV
jgi:uncharacterized protein YjbJ (UPF0337 family)